MQCTPKKATPDGPVEGAGIPGPEEKRWAGVACQVVRRYTDDRGNAVGPRLHPLYLVDPKTGGSASVLDETTWADRSRAHNFAAMMRHRETRDGATWQLAFIDSKGAVRWPDGEPVSKGAA